MGKDIMKKIYLVCNNDSIEEAYTTRKLAEAKIRKWEKEIKKKQIYYLYYLHIHEVIIVK